MARTLKAGLLLAAVLGVTGCGIFGGGGGKEKAPGGAVDQDDHPIRLKLEASERLNSCGDATGNALLVRIYQLTGEGAMAGIALTQLWDRERDELGDDLLDQTELVLDPGKTASVTVARKPGARYLAVAGSFCKTEGSCWRWIRPMADLPSSMSLRCDEFCIQEARNSGR